MTAAERKQRERDRRKAGLVRLEMWVPAEKLDDVKAAVAELLGETATT